MRKANARARRMGIGLSAVVAVHQPCDRLIDCTQPREV
jgi:hypothetical protein